VKTNVARIVPWRNSLFLRDLGHSGDSGALAGAWLGMQATTDLVALLAAIAGAIAGANLALIVLDMTWDRRERERIATALAVSGDEVLGTT
jgi:hypothetical protein